jgi:membrane protein DedA with SNARE-associated domain
MFDQVVDVVSGAWWTYPLILAVCFGDSLLPILPSETAVVTAGVLAGSGRLSPFEVIVVAGLGAFAGDTASYLIGRRWGPAAQRRLLRGDKGSRAVGWAEKMIEQRGILIVAVARFVPGGRTATTLTAGMLGMPYRRRFAVGAGIGAAFWSVYNTLIGMAGGQTFEDEPWKGLLLAFGIALAVTGIIEGVRYVLRRRRRSDGPEEPAV